MKSAATPSDRQATRLRYLNDRGPGIRRQRLPDGSLRYVGADGSVVETLGRIRALAIPPAYEDVWISPLPNSHLQATGRDRRGRKQYRYHPKWRAERDAQKFSHMISFGEALPAIREQVRRDLSRPGLPRRKVLATLVRLLETTLIRVGNEEYARANHSFGLTTMRVNHIDVDGSMLHFTFRGKSGKVHHIDLRSRSMARIVARCKDLPGREVFEYVDDSGEIRSIHSEDVNGYIHDIAGAEFTAKDFRTWAGTLTAFVLLCACGRPQNRAQIKQNLAMATERSALRLGNTASVCRKAYIHPEVFAAYEDGVLAPALPHSAGVRGEAALHPDECALIEFLKSRVRTSRR